MEKDDEASGAVGATLEEKCVRLKPDATQVWTLLMGGLLVAAATCAAERTTWKSVTDVILRIDQRPVKQWNVYRAEKKENLVLVQLGQRFLLLDAKAREVRELDPGTLERKGRDLIWKESKPHTEDTEAQREEKIGAESALRQASKQAPAQRTRSEEKNTAETQRAQRTGTEKISSQRAAAARLMATADWVVRDAGRAWLYRVRLVEEGRLLEVQIGHAPDLRSLY